MIDQKQVVNALLTSQAYSEDPGKIELIQTHISFVFLTERFVYKMKKAVNFGFLDFSSLEKRQLFCEKELQLNKRLCPEVYLEVEPVNKSNIIKIKGIGDTVEYLLKMKRLPQEKIMKIQLREGKVKNQTMDDLANIISSFHLKAQTNKEISDFGSLKIIRINWIENFSQTQKYIDRTILARQFELIQTRINSFMDSKQELFESRLRDGKIRDCHGDMHSGNIFLTDPICIFDAIEFNDRFRYSDVASDVAFLAMDLEFQNKTDLSEYFIERYVTYSKDYELTSVLPFYKCYRAYVRGKVISFKLDDPNVSNDEKLEAIKEAQLYFKLAVEYASKL